MISVGMICRSRDVILRSVDEERGRLCRVVALVPQSRWRHRDMPEFKVELLALPVVTFRRASELIPLRGASTGALAAVDTGARSSATPS